MHLEYVDESVQMIYSCEERECDKLRPTLGKSHELEGETSNRHPNF